MYSFLIQSRSLSYAKIIIIIEMCKYLHSLSCARTGLWFGFLFSGYPPICGDFIFFIAFHGVLFVQFFVSDPVGFSCQYECLHLVNHWFLSLQSPLYSCPSVSRVADKSRNDVQRSGQHLVAVHHVVVQLHDFLGLGMDVCHIQLIGECIAVKKSLQNCTTCPTCPIVPLSQQEMVFLSKLLYINILSFLLHLFFVIWDNGTLGQVGQVVQFCKEFYSLFPLSLAISLRSTLTISLVIIAILFSRTGKELGRIQLVRDVQSLEKALQNCLNCLNVSLSQVELVILSKLLYINILSFLLQLLFIL